MYNINNININDKLCLCVTLTYSLQLLNEIM